MKLESAHAGERATESPGQSVERGYIGVAMPPLPHRLERAVVTIELEHGRVDSDGPQLAGRDNAPRLREQSTHGLGEMPRASRRAAIGQS
jgi:hypothetical protein